MISQVIKKHPQNILYLNDKKNHKVGLYWGEREWVGATAGRARHGFSGAPQSSAACLWCGV